MARLETSRSRSQSSTTAPCEHIYIYIYIHIPHKHIHTCTCIYIYIYIYELLGGRGRLRTNLSDWPRGAPHAFRHKGGTPACCPSRRWRRNVCAWLYTYMHIFICSYVHIDIDRRPNFEECSRHLWAPIASSGMQRLS